VSGLNDDGSAVFDDADRGVNRWALSLGLSYLFNANTTFKAEYRFDGASGPVFLNVKDGRYDKTNQLLGASVLVSF
jgi:opacity protein-like surface antigen